MPGTLTNRMTRVGWIRWIGIRCYAVYLLHSPALVFVARIGGFLSFEASYWHDRIVAVGAVVLTMLAAELSFRYFEQPIIGFGKRWITRRSTLDGLPSQQEPLKVS